MLDMSIKHLLTLLVTTSSCKPGMYIHSKIHVYHQTATCSSKRLASWETLVGCGMLLLEEILIHECFASSALLGHLGPPNIQLIISAMI